MGGAFAEESAVIIEAIEVPAVGMYIGPTVDSAGEGYGWLKWDDGREFTGHVSDSWPDGIGILKNTHSKDTRYFIAVWKEKVMNGPAILLNDDFVPLWVIAYENDKMVETIVENPKEQNSIDVTYGDYRITISKGQLTRLYQLEDGKAVRFAHLYSEGYIYVGEGNDNAEREGKGVGYWFKKNLLELGEFVGKELAPEPTGITWKIE
ncbi:MAG: hypothetical protein FWD25_03060 [Clostridia bacterium]|nr:hypothetical protein [Clostridia bacterium]